MNKKKKNEREIFNGINLCMLLLHLENGVKTASAVLHFNIKKKLILLPQLLLFLLLAVLLFMSLFYCYCYLWGAHFLVSHNVFIFFKILFFFLHSCSRALMFLCFVMLQDIVSYCFFSSVYCFGHVVFVVLFASRLCG